MKLFFAAGASLLVFFIIVQASSGAQHESEAGNVPNKTDAFGAVIDSNTSSIEQHGAAIVGNEAEEKRRSLVGSVVGSILSYSEHDWSEIEALSPDVFFLVLLPPIIFENAYNLNKGYFFSNIGPILSFAILGTAISALADLVYEFSIFECFAFASMISAVDPVATLAIFQAVKVEGLLYMLVFGESMLNDAVSIVFAATAIRHSHPPLNSLGPSEILWSVSTTFLTMFTLSALLGLAIGLLSALLFKHVDLRKTPSLEFALLLVFAYIPYGFAEAMSLSGIMAILFCGITMSQYTQQNISPVTQITFRQTFRTISFVAGMRGAVCFALVLYMEVEKEKKSVILTTTLFLILFTTLFLGGTVMPFISFINKCYPEERPRRRRRNLRKHKDTVMMSKTQEMAMFGSDEWTPKRNDQSDRPSTAAGRIMKQLFVRKFTASERQENREKLAALTRRALLNDDTDSEVDEGAPTAPLMGSLDADFNRGVRILKEHTLTKKGYYENKNTGNNIVKAVVNWELHMI
ncbi:sodium/hydrogen exchanger 3 [Ancylostoma duodenale]|uniref:Sodium/hydrogen exchanger 8 n=1 Tax=Ancylostoma duodenale TaxID=51022 RepID=A0A0C2E248_9BILA|nr:sodium/hydrogen exchanger 3 [Ancylostoma duodenale]